MPTTDFQNGTLITSTWCNEVDSHVFDQDSIAHESDNIRYTPEGTGVTVSTVQAKLREIISVMDYGAVGDGSTDDSVAFNKASAAAAAANALLFVPKPATSYFFSNPWLITNDNPYGACDGLTVKIAAGTEIIESTTYTSPKLIEIDGVTNVTIEGYGATINGNILNRANGWPTYGTATISTRTNATMSLIIGNETATSNVTIRGLYLKDGIEDNIYVRANADNIRLIDVHCYGAGRNNLSCSGVSNFYAENCLFENARQWFTDDFGYGVDIEPATASEKIYNVNFTNCIARKNYDGGFYILAANMDNTSPSDVVARFHNCVDEDSGWDTNAGAHHGNKAVGFSFYVPAATATIRNDVEFVGCTSKNANNYGFEIIRRPESLGSVRITNCHAEDWNRLASNSGVNVGAFAIRTLTAGTQNLAVHISGSTHKKDSAGTSERIINYGASGEETYENIQLGEITVSGSLSAVTQGAGGITATNYIGSATLVKGPTRPFPLMPSAVWVTGTGTQTISNNSVTKLTVFSGGTESSSFRHNFDRCFSLTNNEWTPKEPGFYMVYARTRLGTLVDNSRVYLALFQDPATGVFAELFRSEQAIIGTSATSQDFELVRPVFVPALGYKYDLRVFQLTGGNSDALGSGTEFHAVRVA